MRDQDDAGLTDQAIRSLRIIEGYGARIKRVPVPGGDHVEQAFLFLAEHGGDVAALITWPPLKPYEAPTRRGWSMTPFRGVLAGLRRFPYDLVRSFAWVNGALLALVFFVQVLGPWLKAHGWMS